MIDLTFLHQLNRFNILIKRRVHSHYAGLRQSRVFGTGLVFYDYRQYVPGDNFRNVDWKVYGRTNELFVRRFEEERNMRVHVIIDASSSMDFGAKIKKFEYASMIGLGFCYMALRNNERFEVSTFADDLKIYRAQKGMNKLISSFYTLNEVKLKGKSKFSESLENYKSVVKTKSMVIIISDFLFDLAQLRNILPSFKKSEVLCVQVLDVEETNPTMDGDVLLEDSETREYFRTFISNRFKENYNKELLKHITEINNICDTLNMKFVTVTTDTPIFDAFYRMLA